MLTDQPLIRDDMNATPWQCSGHPPAVLPLTIDGFEITRFSDVERIVREHIAAPTSMLVALYERLAGTPLQPRIEAVASRLLTDENSRVRMRALGFYSLHPSAGGGGRVLELAQGNREGFNGPQGPSLTQKRCRS